MSKTKQYVTAATTFSVALGIGFVMQYGDAVASRWGADRPVAGPSTRTTLPDRLIVPVSASVAVPTTLALPNARSVQETVASVLPVDIETPSYDIAIASPVAVPDQIVLAAVEETLPPPTIEMVEADPVELVESCEISLTATPIDLAMVDLHLSSPCRTDAVVAIHHQGMMFNEITGPEGDLSVKVPALSAEAFFIAAFDDGDGAVAVTGVNEVELYDRAVLQWQGEDDVQLHALEFGATYGEPGHVWSASAADAAIAADGQGGFLTQLGNAAAPQALMAEVYTYPSGLSARGGAIALSVEAEVTARNCGRKVEAQSIQVGPDIVVKTIDVALTMPDCTAQGDYLVLKNMFEDLTLAAK